MGIIVSFRYRRQADRQTYEITYIVIKMRYLNEGVCQLIISYWNWSCHM